MSDRPFLLRYRIDRPAGGVPRAQALIDQDEWGAADAVLLCSLRFDADGGLSIAFASLDGRTDKPLSVDEQFKAWVLLAHTLAESNELGDGRRLLCQFVHESIKRALEQTADDIAQRIRDGEDTAS